MSVVLEDSVLVDGDRVTASLTLGGLLRWEGSGRGRSKGSSSSLDILNDVIGISRDTSAITLHAFPLSSFKCCGGRQNRFNKDYYLDFGNDVDAHNNWSRAIQRILDDSGRPKRLLVLVNPFGGKSLGKKLYLKEVEPLFKKAGIHVVMRETQFQSHAKDLAKSCDLSQYDGIVCLSGDGVLAEVLNGLLGRADWDRAIKTPLGIIPAGTFFAREMGKELWRDRGDFVVLELAGIARHQRSRLQQFHLTEYLRTIYQSRDFSGTGNGMAKSILEAGHEDCNIASATFAIIRGNKQSLDVATAVQGQVKFHSLLMLSWGFVSDVDFESEKWRYLGDLRLDVQAYIRLFWLRQYHGSLAYIPGPGFEERGEPCNKCLEEAVLLQKPADSDTDRTWRRNGYSGPLTTPESSKWRSIEGPFIYIWAQNVPYAGLDILAAPKAKFSDGYYDLLVIRDCPRLKLISILLGLKSGSHVKSKYVEYLKVKAFRLAPGGIVGGSFQGGYVDLDGEVLARGEGAFGDGGNDPMLYGPTIEVSIEKALATVFVPPLA